VVDTKRVDRDAGGENERFDEANGNSIEQDFSLALDDNPCVVSTSARNPGAQVSVSNPINARNSVAESSP